MGELQTVALIVAAGRGERFGGTLPKQYAGLDGIPVLRRSILAFANHPAVDAVRVVIETASFVVATEGKALTSAANGDGVQVALEGGKTVWGMANPGKVVQIR